MGRMPFPSIDNSLAQVARLRDAAGNVCFFVFRESHIVIEGVPLNVQRR